MLHVTLQSLETKVAAWRAAGIVDAATAARILAHEGRGARPRLPSLLGLLGGLAILLGLAALVGANWEDLPLWLKLGGHGALNLGLGVAAWAAARRRGWRAEALLLLLSGSTLALVAHIGQSFQLQGNLTGLLGAWLLLATPFSFGLMRSDFNRWLWTAGFVAWLGLWLVDVAQTLAAAYVLGAAVAVVVAGAAAAPGVPRLDPGWAAHLRRVALAALALLVTVAQLAWRLEGGDLEPPAAANALVGALTGAAGLALAHFAVHRRAAPASALAFVVLAPVVAALPVLVGGAGSPLAEGVAISAVWIAIAAVALERGRAGLYRLAVALVAARLCLAFVEAAGGLAATGLGLVASGLALVGLGVAAEQALRWARRRTAPEGGQ